MRLTWNFRLKADRADVPRPGADAGEPARARQLSQRYIRQMNAQENQLETLRGKRAQLEQQRDAAQKELDTMIGNLTFDRKL